MLKVKGALMMHLKSVYFKKNEEDYFPYQLPFFGHKFSFSSPVTLIVGDNGSGKSTFLELIHAVIGLYKINHRRRPFEALTRHIEEAKKDVKCVYHLNKPKGFYFSAEDFTSYIHDLVQEKNDSYLEIKRIDEEYADKSDFAKSLAKMPHMKTITEINELYQHDLLTSSHGEAYLDFFKSRLHDHELYLLDEPETPLSIQNQFALLALIDKGVKQHNQFIISTHSPILMAIPYAEILLITNEGMKKTSYEDIESVALLKKFMQHPESFFKYLYENDEK